jgi:SAM-dependent methyltransferase
MARFEALPRVEAYDAPELYDLVYPGFAGDEGYYRRCASTGRVLYLGAGTGRLFASIAACNPNVLGVDNSAAMLDALRKLHPRVTERQLLLADVRDPHIVPEHTFDVVIGPFCFLEVLGTNEWKTLLANVARWLKPGGWFHTDTFSPFSIPFRRTGFETIGWDADDGSRVEIYIDYDHASQSMHERATVLRGGREQLIEMHLTYLFPREVTSAILEAGFDSLGIYGGHHGEPYNPSRSDVVLYSARNGGQV